MTGILLIDKPSGPTSHDIVARLRRATGQRRIGHAGTLDPRATGLLVVMMGNATRLASLLTGHDKTYEATVQLGWATTTDDADGDRIDGSTGPLPTPEELERALKVFHGTYEQMPPQYSAKKVDGKRAYSLARKNERVALKTSTVTVQELSLLECGGDLVRLRMTVSPGFYVRALARDLGERLGCGAHLDQLRRTQSGAFLVSAAIPIDEAEQLGPEVESQLWPLADALPELRAVTLSENGLIRVRHGNPIGPQLVDGQWVAAEEGGERVCLLDPQGTLVALADLRGGFLHPAVVLG